MKNVNFKNYFGTVINEEIVKFCERINNSNADVIILMARKAACFFQYLAENGYIDERILEKNIITDRAIDLSDGFLLDEKILIIDDVIFSGSTIAKTIFSLLDSGVNISNISILVLAINKDTFKMKFTNDNIQKDIFRMDDGAKLNNAECIKLCADISRLLSLVGKPYDVDFPAYYEVILSSKNQDLWSLFPMYWTLYNISNEYHKQAEIEAYTLIPSDITLNIIWDYLGINLSEIAEYKIRIYSYINEGIQRFKSLPMVIFNEISYTTLECIFEKVCKVLGNHGIEIARIYTNVSSKTRFLQYFIANLLNNIFFNLIKIDAPKIIDNSITYLFGYENIQLLKNCLKMAAKDCLVCCTQSEYTAQTFTLNRENYCNILEYENKEKDILDPFDINLKLLDPFLYWYNKKEKQARNLLADSHVDLNNKNFFDDINRLEVGFSFQCLKQILYYIREYYNIDHLVSVFIDRAVDLGIIVPIIFIDNERKIVCRAFRHGEDLPYSDRERHLILFFLKEFFDKINDKKISNIQFQKIVTFYLQLGIKNNLFSAFTGFDNSQLLSVKYCIHGAVPVVVGQGVKTKDLHPYVIRNNYSEWLSARMLRDGAIKKSKDSVGITFGNNFDDLDISQHDRTITGKIATVLAKWFNLTSSMNKKSVFTDDLVALTSCLDTQNFVSAILAELYICQADWNESLSKLLAMNNRWFETGRQNFLDGMRQSNVFIAMNSGRRKYLWYKKDEKGENHVNKIISDVHNLLAENDDSLAPIAWEELMNENMTIKQSANFLDANVIACVGYIYCYNVFYRMLEYVLLDNSELSEERKRGIRAELDDLQKEYEDLHFERNQINFILNLLDLNMGDAINRARRYMIALDAKVEEDMRSIEQYISKTSEQYITKYHSCIVFDIEKQKKQSYLKKIENILNDVSDKVILEVSEQLFTRICVAYNSPITKGAILMKLHKIYEVIGDVPKRIIVFPILPKGQEFRMNHKINPQANIMRFKDKILVHVEKLYSGDVPKDNEVIFVSECGDEENEPTREDLKTIEEFKLIQSGDIQIPFCKERYSYMKGSNYMRSIGIITVIPEEFNAVKQRYEMKRMPSSSNQKGVRIFYGSNINVNNTLVHLVMTQVQGQGNQAGTAAYYGLCQAFQLDCVVLLGIAGSLDEKKAKIGDVVIARSVYDGQLGKEIPGGFLPETTVYNPNAHINSIILDYMNEANESNSQFACMYEPIGNNGHLITDKDSRFVNNLKDNINRKVIAAEMEAAGVSYGVYQAMLDGLCENLIVIRGISDYADLNKSPSNQYHRLASDNAVEIFDKLLERIIE